MSPTNKRRGSAVLSAAAAAAIVVGASSSDPPPPCSSARPLTAAAPATNTAAPPAAATSSLSFARPSKSTPRPVNAPFGMSWSCRTMESLRGGDSAPSSSSTTETHDASSANAAESESGSHVAGAADGSNVRGGAVEEKKPNKRKKKKKSRKKSKPTKTANDDENVDADADASTDTTTHAEAREKEASPKDDKKSSEPHHLKHKPKTHKSNSQQDAIIASIMSASDHYAVLGVTKSASDVEIKKAYRRRAVRTHPDKVLNSDRSAFDKVAKAYEVLSDETKRGIYDRFGDAGVEAGGNPNPGAFGFGSGGIFGAGNAEEMFSRYFGGAGGRGSPNFNPFQPRNANKRFQMEIDLEDLYNGITREVTMTHPQTSPSGRRRRKTVEVIVQRGMMTGQSIVLPGEMDQVPNSAPADMIFVLAQRRHATFSRRGHDLAIDVTISLREALCGFRRSFIHLDGRTVVIAPPRGKKIHQERKMIHPDNGEANIADEVERPREVPIIVRSGDVHVLKGEGMPKLARGNSRGGGYGDLYVQYKVEMPSTASGAGSNLTVEERDELDRLLRKLEGSSSNASVQGTELMGEEIDADGNKIRYMQKASAEDYGRASGTFETNEHHHGEEHLHADDEDNMNNSFFQAFGGRGYPASGFHYYSSSGQQDGNGEQQCQQM